MQNPWAPAQVAKFPGLWGWLWSDRTGVSSLTMVAAIAGRPELLRRNRPSLPHDPDDLNRCFGLLSECPELRPHLAAVSELHPEWAPIIDRWDELLQMRSECRIFEIRDVLEEAASIARARWNAERG